MVSFDQLSEAEEIKVLQMTIKQAREQQAFRLFQFLRDGALVEHEEGRTIIVTFEDRSPDHAAAMAMELLALAGHTAERVCKGI